MELRHLRYFAAVAQHLNYSEAARRLHVAQPAISQTVLDLEAELGVRLLERTRRSVELTIAGKVFLNEAGEILRRSEDAIRLTQRAALGEVGTLSIGFFGSATALFLPDLVRRYRQEFPQVELRLHELTPEQQMVAFEEGRIDLSFTRPLPSEQSVKFHEETIYTDHLAIALPPGHPLACQKTVRLEKLAAEPFVQFHRKGAPGLFDTVIAACQQAGFSPRVISEPDFMATVLTLVESGLGVSLVPGNVRNLNRPQIIFRTITPKSSEIPLRIAWLKANRNPALEAFVKLTRETKPSIQQQMERQV